MWMKSSLGLLAYSVLYCSEIYNNDSLYSRLSKEKIDSVSG